MKDLKFKKRKTKLPALGVLFLCGGEATRHSLAVPALTIFAFTANCRLVLVGCAGGGTGRAAKASYGPVLEKLVTA